MLSDLTIIIRSAGERTLPLCRQLLAELHVPDTQVFVVEEVPFSAAMRKSFEIGIRAGRKWTFCVDADVLLRPGAILHMLEEAEKQAENVCEIQGLVLDKFFGGPRPAGNHLYRTSLLQEVLQRIPAEGTDIRPEHYTLESMRAAGYPWVQIPYIVGTHDDYQYFADIYRKCFVQGVKHVYLAGLFVPLWKRSLDTDPDFQVALRAFADSIAYNEPLYINRKQDIYRAGFQKMRIKEKEPVGSDAISLEKIEQIITDWKDAAEYPRYFPGRFGLVPTSASNEMDGKVNMIAIITNTVRTRGLFGGMLHVTRLTFSALRRKLIK